MLLFGNSGARWTIEDNYFAKGGEGELYNLVGHNDLVAKIYKSGVLNATRQAKLTYMSSIYSSERLQQLAWPKDILKDSYGNVKGFVMRRFSATKDLANLLDGSSNNSSDKLDWLKRIVISLNLSYLVNEIHSMGQVIGDMNPKNFGVDMNSGFVCAFDTDSFHLRDVHTGKWYPCTVLDEHYIAPEFQTRLRQGGRVDSFRPEETFTRETDHFALAVLIFQLLFNGVHPFTAARVPSRGSSVVIHTRETNIYQRMSPFFNPSPNTTVPVYAPPLSIVPFSVQAMFKKAFLQDVRPTAKEWAAQLSSLVLQTEKCSKGHYYGRYNTNCPWCAMEDKIMPDPNKGHNHEQKQAQKYRQVKNTTPIPNQAPVPNPTPISNPTPIPNPPPASNPTPASNQMQGQQGYSIKKTRSWYVHEILNFLVWPLILLIPPEDEYKLTICIIGYGISLIARLAKRKNETLPTGNGAKFMAWANTILGISLLFGFVFELISSDGSSIDEFMVLFFTMGCMATGYGLASIKDAKK